MDNTIEIPQESVAISYLIYPGLLGESSGLDIPELKAVALTGLKDSKVGEVKLPSNCPSIALDDLVVVLQDEVEAISLRRLAKSRMLKSFTP